MNLDELRKLLAYDSWANARLLDALEGRSAAELERDLGTSHRSLLGTMVHIVAAEEIWLSRWKGAPRAKLTSVEEIADTAALRHWWSGVERERDGFVAGLGEDDLERELEIATASGASYRHRFSDMFRHVVNHSSYHRGQLVTMLRQLGATPPPTDLIRFLRESSR